MTVSKLTVMDGVAAAANGAQPARDSGVLRLGRGEFPPGQRLVMAIVNGPARAGASVTAVMLVAATTVMAAVTTVAIRAES